MAHLKASPFQQLPQALEDAATGAEAPPDSAAASASLRLQKEEGGEGGREGGERLSVIGREGERELMRAKME